MQFGDVIVDDNDYSDDNDDENAVDDAVVNVDIRMNGLFLSGQYHPSPSSSSSICSPSLSTTLTWPVLFTFFESFGILKKFDLGNKLFTC